MIFPAGATPASGRFFHRRAMRVDELGWYPVHVTDGDIGLNFESLTVEAREVVSIALRRSAAWKRRIPAPRSSLEKFAHGGPPQVAVMTGKSKVRSITGVSSRYLLTVTVGPAFIAASKALSRLLIVLSVSTPA